MKVCLICVCVFECVLCLDRCVRVCVCVCEQQSNQKQSEFKELQRRNEVESCGKIKITEENALTKSREDRLKAYRSDYQSNTLQAPI